MPSPPKRQLAGISKEIVEGIPSAGTFEGIPKIRKVAGASAGPRCKDKVVIITGTNSPLGIGRATAHQYAENGAKAIFICDFDSKYLDIHKREINSLYPAVDVHTRQFDASDEASVKAVVDEAVEKYGRLDVFFANAGISSGKMFYDYTAEEFMKMMKVNALSVFLAAKYGSRAMLKTSPSKPYPSGSIIGTASTAGIRSNAGTTDYSAAKAAVISIMQTCSYQLSGTGIRCNAICPGLIETGMTNAMFESARARGTEKKIGQLNPLKRGAVPDEVARVVLFLGSDEASYMNGQAIAVDGALSAGHPYVLGKLA
ncbi:NAD(P)-binding protein [Rhizodiscina lignyota]|uniref:NAD(P)-binding protein n=1 Tax=Rhizodiscina lignyota TaxID=1504668 RepID=A0A9P4I4R9_9PEZI|nr:NAD(P)-binding protein [Rhizodiscina lignyota]